VVYVKPLEEAIENPKINFAKQKKKNKSPSQTPGSSLNDLSCFFGFFSRKPFRQRNSSLQEPFWKVLANDPEQRSAANLHTLTSPAVLDYPRFPRLIRAASPCLVAGRKPFAKRSANGVLPQGPEKQRGKKMHLESFKNGFSF